MADDPGDNRSVPIGGLVLLICAGALYAAQMTAATSHGEGGGEAVFGEALQAFFATLALWIVLGALTLAACVWGRMPRWAAIAGGFLLPLSSVASFVAIDMVSRGIVWGIVFPAALPPLIAFHALWARMPRWHEALPPGPTSRTVWGLVLALSLAPLILAVYY